jgi:hypothetical protein
MRVIGRIGTEESDISSSYHVTRSSRVFRAMDLHIPPGSDVFDRALRDSQEGV